MFAYQQQHIKLHIFDCLLCFCNWEHSRYRCDKAAANWVSWLVHIASHSNTYWSSIQHCSVAYYTILFKLSIAHKLSSLHSRPAFTGCIIRLSCVGPVESEKRKRIFLSYSCVTPKIITSKMFTPAYGRFFQHAVASKNNFSKLFTP